MPTALEILLDQSTEKADKNAKTLAQTRQQLGQARDKLQMLETYLEETQGRLQTQTTGTGFTGFQLKNQMAFSSKIADAVKQQAQQVYFYEQTETHQLKQWQLALAEQKKYEALIEREKRRAMAIEAKRDQKMNDEFAARIHRVRATGESA